LNTQNNTNSATSCKKHTLRACAIETLTLWWKWILYLFRFIMFSSNT
jgi:hypothetical protein